VNTIFLIRHAEKPAGDIQAVDENGTHDSEALTVRGWQRAGALAHFFSSQLPVRPNVIFASGIGTDSKSHRPKQTVTPLAELIKMDVNTNHLKNDLDPLIEDVRKQTGTVLVAWEHQLIPDLVGELPNAPAVPKKWPDDRFDIVWVLDADGANWKFSQIPQMLLAGDSSKPIP